jgi:CRP/FNR family transcriptional regulator, cyclic AMP receptor protein
MKLVPEVEGALEASFFGALPDEARDRLISDAMLLQLPAGSDLVRVGEAWAGLLLVASGLFKTYLTSPDGRLVTIRYARRGSLIGAGPLFYDRPSRASAQAITDVQAVTFNPDSVRQAGHHR